MKRGKPQTFTLIEKLKDKVYFEPLKQASFRSESGSSRDNTFAIIREDFQTEKISLLENKKRIEDGFQTSDLL
jgi:hypothetical protein